MPPASSTRERIVVLESSFALSSFIYKIRQCQSECLTRYSAWLLWAQSYKKNSNDNILDEYLHGDLTTIVRKGGKWKRPGGPGRWGMGWGWVSGCRTWRCRLRGRWRILSRTCLEQGRCTVW